MTGSSINSTGTGGTIGTGASGLNTSTDNNGGGASAPAKSSTMRPGDNDPKRQTQGGRQAEPNAPGTQSKIDAAMPDIGGSASEIIRRAASFRTLPVAAHDEGGF